MKSNMKLDKLWIRTDNIIWFIVEYDSIAILTTAQNFKVSLRNDNLKKLENLFWIREEEDLVKEEK